MKELRIFQTKTGKRPFLQWLNKLKDARDRARIRRRLDRLQLGQYGDVKSCGNSLFELRCFFGPGYRIYFTEQNDAIVVLLCAGDKNSQKKDIELARSYIKTLKEFGGKYD